MVSLILLAGCGAHSDTGAPSSNASLNAISPSSVNKEKKGYLQESYDTWEKEEWEPNTREPEATKDAKETSAAAAGAVVTSEDNQSAPAPTATRENNASDETFTLQHYVDKWKRYNENTETNETAPSNAERLDAMPAIGK